MTVSEESGSPAKIKKRKGTREGFGPAAAHLGQKIIHWKNGLKKEFN